MKSQIKKALDTLDEKNLLKLLSFIEDEDIDFLREKDYTKVELLESSYNFFEGKNDQTLKVISQDLHKFEEALHDKIFSKRDIKNSQTQKEKLAKKSGDSLTPNQTMVLNRIKKLLEKSPTGLVRTDNIDIRNKSKFFIGGVLTTLVERKIVLIEIIDKKKYAKILK